MKLKNRKTSYLTGLPEGQGRQSWGARLLRWIYFAVLLALIIFIGRYVYLRWSQFEGYGEVVIERITIAPLRSGRIARLAEAGDQRLAGEFLAEIRPLEQCRAAPQPELLRIERQIAVKQAELDSLRQQWQDFNRQSTLRRALEIDPGRSSALRQLPYQINLARQALVSEQRYLEKLRLLEAAREVPTACQPENLVAPYTGTVVQVFKNAHETIQAVEPLLAFEPEQAGVFIEGYLSKYDIESLVPGKSARIVFPDDTEAKGVITDIESAAEVFARPKWLDYEPVDSPVKVRIEPLAREQAGRWRSFHRLRVKISGDNG